MRLYKIDPSYSKVGMVLWQEMKALHVRRRLGCSYVFQWQGRQIKDFRGGWDAACRKVGLKGRLFHDFRRTAIRNMVRAGGPERVAMSLSGHKTRSVFERYNIVSDEDLKEAARRQQAYHERAQSGHSGQKNGLLVQEADWLNLLIWLVPEVGVEPTWTRGPRDFESR